MPSYIIDGNNLMGRKRTRLELLEMLADFLEIKKVKLHVVFDGAPEPNYPEGATYHGVKISYSSRGQDADKKIRRLVEKAPNPREVIIVTSDRSLANYAKICSAKHMYSTEFLSLLAEEKSKHKTKEEKPAIKGEMNEWLRYFGFRPNEANLDYQDPDED
ncbi:MAG: NYN domain-containing protein [Acidobacteria bacterium]|nr:NYN domain-containing protein [Acidobacteriota bacterium]